MKLMLGGLAPGTIQIKLNGARTRYNALRWAGATESNPFEDVKGPCDERPAWEQRKPYTAEEVVKLRTKARPVDRVLVLLGAHAGLRVAEMVALRWQDVDLSAQQLRVVRGKGGKPRTVWISAGLARALEALRPYARNERVLGFGSTERARARMQRLVFRALVKYRGIHSLRHTCVKSQGVWTFLPM